jgi:RND superfamily putative drug exporter
VRRLSSLVTGRAWAIVLMTAVLTVGGAVATAGVEDRLSSGGFGNTSWDSSRAAAVLASRFHTGVPNLLLLVSARNGSVDDLAMPGRELAARLRAEEGVGDVVSYWDGARALRSDDGTQALVTAWIAGDEDTIRAVAGRLMSGYTVDTPQLSVRIGGTAEIFRELTAQSATDLRRAELIILPITAVLLIALFGSLAAAALPLLVGGVAVVGTTLMLRALTSFTPVSIFALNLTTGLGLGLAIDYSLFIVSRYREELAAGRDHNTALARCLQTAGRTVLFSAVTVAVALASMLVFPIAFLRSMAYAGIAVVTLATIGALVVLPAALVVLGPRVEWGSIRRRSRRQITAGFWYRRARAVMRRPVLTVVAASGVLVLLGSPFFGLTLGDNDDRVLPADAPARLVSNAVRTHFAGVAASTVTIVSETSAPASAALDTYARTLSSLPAVSAVVADSGEYVAGQRIGIAPAPKAALTSGGATWLQVTSTAPALAPQGVALAQRIRATPAPMSVLVGGPAASLLDGRDSLAAHLPAAVALIGLATIVVVFLMVGSVLVPLKAFLLNMLSLSATFGTLVWVFQDGRLSSVLDFTPTGTISLKVPVLLFCIAFGLSMDYEVFLLSRIKEEYDAHGDNDAAVARGLERTGHIVTAAALLLSLVFVGFLTSGVAVIKVIGLGLAVAILVDAFVVRMTLVPALMRIAGRYNWWAPRSLRRLHLLVGVWEDEPAQILDVGRPGRLRRRD